MTRNSRHQADQSISLCGNSPKSRPLPSTFDSGFVGAKPLFSLAAFTCMLLAGSPSDAQTLGIAYGGGGASGASGGPAAGGTGGNAGVSGPTAGSDSRSGIGGANGGTALSGSPASGLNGSNAYDGSGMEDADGAGGGAGGFGIVLSNASGNLSSNATITGGTGGVGGWGSYGGGGGGGGGSALYVETSSTGTSLTIDAAITGGAGGVGGTSGGGGYNTTSGAGGNSSGTGGSGAVGHNGSGGGSGGGGGGGVQFVSTASGTTTITNHVSVIGGNGGNGGRDAGGNGRGGNAGNGGNGIALSGSQIQLTNTGNITGGNGGQPGPCDTFCTGGAGSGGSGGIGLVVSGGNNTIVNSGGISGGLVANGTTRANAMTLSGGGNTLELQTGYTFNGNVVSSSGTTNGGDTLALGGSTDSSFDLSRIGFQYQGFNSFKKTGTSTWVVTGTTATSWSIANGTLQIGNGGTSGAINGNITNNASLVFDRSNAVTYSGIISGSGDLTKLGTGTLTLSGANTYMGDTNVSTGTLRAGAANVFGNGSATTIAGGATLDLNNFSQTLGSLAGSGNLSLGSALLTVGNNTSTTFSGVISGTGGLNKQGNGMLTLSGANTYSGSTTVSGGRLQAGAVNVFGNGNATTVNAGTALDLNNFNQTLGSLAGSGNLSLGSALLTVGNNANTTFSGIISGTGGLNKQGSATLTLSGANTYSGSTTVNDGTLRAGAVNVFGNDSSATVNIGATLDLNNFNQTLASLAGSGNVILGSAQLATGNNTNTIFSGSITGTGGLTKTGSGILTLSGANTYGGDTIINDGTLQIGDGGTTGSVTGNIVNDAALVFNRSNDLAYGGDISGAGSLAQNGTGKLILTGTHSYTGNTVVSAGTLSINGSIVSATSILNGGILGGTGTTGNVNVESGGTLAPGNSIGTLTIHGNLSFASGSIYRVEADAAGNSDRVNVSGTALLNGSVMALPASGNYATNTRYTILNADGGFNGTSFSDVSSDLTFLTPDLSYDANNVYLRLRRNDVAYASMARTRNQLATADALQQASLDSSGDMDTALNAVNNLSAAQAPTAYDRIGGAGLIALRRAGSSFAAGFGNQIQARLNAVGTVASAQSINGMQLAANDRVTDLMPRLAQADTEKFTLAGGIPVENTLHGFWLRGYGTHQETDSDGNAASTRLKEAGISVGVDARVRDNLVIGAAFSHGDADMRVTFEETGKSRGNAAAVYASYASGPWNINGHLTLAHHANNMQRRIQIGTLDRNASARFDSKTIAAYGEASYDLQQDGWKLLPLAGLALTHGKTDGFTETGADALNLQVDAQSMTSIRTLIGAKALFELKNGISLQPRAIWAHEFGDINKGMTAQLQGAPAIAFTTYGVDLPRDALIAGLTVAGKPGERLSLFADVQGEFNSKQTNLGLLLGLRASW